MAEGDEGAGGRRAATSGLAVLEEETEKNDRMIQMRVALDYLAELIDPKHKDAFIRAERAARTVEEMNRVLELAKKYVAQKVLIDILDLRVE
jgi:hypothetical protein